MAKKTAHPRPDLRALREEGLGLSRRKLAGILGIAEKTIERYETGETQAPSWYEGQLKQLRAGQHVVVRRDQGVDSDAYTAVPLVKPRLSAGGGSVVYDEEPEAWLHFRTEWLKQIGPVRQLVLMRIEGDSMEPTLHEDDVVMIHTGKRELRPGKLYAIGLGERLLVKRLHPAVGGGIEIISDNQRYGKEVVQEDEPGFRIVGQAVWMARKLD